MKKATSIFCILTLILSIVLFANSTYAYRPASLTVLQKPGAEGAWVAPSIVGLDWTADKWLASLPKYNVEAAPQLNTLVSATSPTAPPPTDLSRGGLTPDPEVPESSLASGATEAPVNPLLVYGAFITPLSNDAYAGADTGLTGIVWGQYEIYRCSDNAFLGYGLTNSGGTAGQFSKTIENPYSLGFRVWIIPKSSAGSVRTGTGGANSYGTVTGCLYPGEVSTYNIGTWNIYSGSSYTYRGAWMIYETMVEDALGRGGWNFFVNELGAYGTSMPYTIVRFPYETWAHYHWGGEIHLPTLNDARSPDVILHEYAHMAMYTTYGGGFTTYCPSPHYINGVSHVNCAWSEGWASYVPYMTHNDKTYTYANNFDVNEETPTWGTSGWSNGAAVEGRVTAALIDLDDSANDGWDVTYGWRSNLWWVFKYKGMNVNFHDFMADFKSVRPYNTPIVLTIWQNTIYYLDL